jgi:hypothetical protein
MKKLLLSLTAGVLSVATMYGQGRVAFQNQATFNTADAITVRAVVPNVSNNQGATGGNAGDGIGGDKYSVQLRWAAGSFATQALFDAANPTSSAVFTGSVFLANTGPLATFSGFFDAGTVANVGAPGPFTMQTWAWYSVGAGNAAYAAATGNKGASALFTVNVTASPAGINSTIFPGFTVGTPVPEPSTFALAGLGAAALLLFRRRK